MEWSCGLRSHLLVGLCVCRSVFPESCGKTADWIRMPFGTVGGVGREVCVLDGVGDRRRGRGSFGVNVGRTIVTICDFVA